MNKNMGTADKLVRFLIAAVIVGLFTQDIISGTLGIILLIFASVFVLTSIISFCPLYTILSVKTCKRK